MNNPWFRMYAEAVDDDKLRLLDFSDRWHFIAILCCKGQGVLDTHSSTLDRRVAVKLGLPLQDALDVRERLIEVGLVDEDWQPSAWDSRQFSSDSSTDRTRKYREKKSAAAREITEEQHETSQERSSDALEQNRTEQNRTDTESTTQQPDEPPPEKPKKRAASAAIVFDPIGFLVDRGVEHQAAADYVAVRKGKKAPATETALKQIESEARKAGVPLQVAVTECCARGWAGFKAEWLTNSQNGARAGPAQRMTTADERRHTIAVLTGQTSDERTSNDERDITGESRRIA